MSGTWLLALGDSFKAVRDEPRPYRMARPYCPRFAGQQAGCQGAAEAASARGGRRGGAAAALSETDEGAGSAAWGAAAGRQMAGIGIKAARANWKW